ncbi:hypothetical protein [Streptomyces sp. NPDC053431]|uniref:Imm32 family immunity protein n=1 Tax=Streptomyces sp. NPDC053431 TaxID=3365703 RepID=UPI0037D004E3
MLLDYSHGYGEVVLTASSEELARVADAVASGGGFVPAMASSSGGALRGVEIKTVSAPGVLIRLDVEAQVLVISGDAAGRTVLADNLRWVASAGAGGHLHIEYHSGHFYLGEGSMPLVVSSPHGGIQDR